MFSCFGTSCLCFQSSKHCCLSVGRYTNVCSQFPVSIWARSRNQSGFAGGGRTDNNSCASSLQRRNDNSSVKNGAPHRPARQKHTVLRGKSTACSATYRVALFLFRVSIWQYLWEQGLRFPQRNTAQQQLGSCQVCVRAA